MGFWDKFFNKEVSSNKKLMLDCISMFMKKYSVEHEDQMENIAYVYAGAIQIIKQLNEKQLKKGMRANGVVAECAALNILQNCAMQGITPASGADLIIDHSGELNLYMAVNDEKLRRNFISKQQYEDNRLLGIKLKIGSPI